jgi:hypothetical protein
VRPSLHHCRCTLFSPGGFATPRFKLVQTSTHNKVVWVSRQLRASMLWTGVVLNACPCADTLVCVLCVCVCVCVYCVCKCWITHFVLDMYKHTLAHSEEGPINVTALVVHSTQFHTRVKTIQTCETRQPPYTLSRGQWASLLWSHIHLMCFSADFFCTLKNIRHAYALTHYEQGPVMSFIHSTTI